MLLEKDHSATQSKGKLAPKDRVTFKSSEPDRFCLQVDAFGEGFLVLTETAYPGWVCRIDGENAPIERADFAFQAVCLPAGSHEVIFEFAPRSLQLGFMLSWTGVALVTIFGFGAVLIGRKKKTSADLPVEIVGGADVDASR